MVALDAELARHAPSLPPSDLTDVAAARALSRQRAAAQPAYHHRDGIDVRDVTVSDPRGDIPVRLYRPVEGGSSLPGVVWLHGGAFIVGNLDSSDALCARISDELGAVVVNVDYRLAPEHPYPAGLDDACAAFEWLACGAADLGVDPGRIAVAGSSAGACLAAGVALRMRDNRGPAIAYQLLTYPVLDDRDGSEAAMTMADVPVFNSASRKQMWQTYLGDGEADAYAAPARATRLDGLPPAFLLAAEHDPARDDAVDYARGLLAASVPVELVVMPYTFHGFDTVVPDAAISRRAVSTYMGALSRALGAT